MHYGMKNQWQMSVADLWHLILVLFSARYFAHVKIVA